MVLWCRSLTHNDALTEKEACISKPAIKRLLTVRQYLLACLYPVFLSGCLSPLAMHEAVLQYDRTVGRLDAEMLLLNIARSRHFHPNHFTALSSVAATFEFSTSAGIAPAGSNTEALIAPVLGASASERPTMTIIPVQGEEFTTRILAPFDESKVAFLFQQGVEPAIVLRLMVRELVLSGYGESATLHNEPHRREEYQEFRRRVLHLSSLNLTRNLYIGPIVYEDALPFTVAREFTRDPTTAGLESFLDAIRQGYAWVQGPDKRSLVLSKQVVGRLAITNYDPATLSNEERRLLNAEAQRNPRHVILLDIRPDQPGGEYPLHGSLVIRSFNAILQFLALGIAADPEYHVDKDPRTGAIGRNPPWTVSIEETEERPQDAAFAVKYLKRWYSVRRAAKVKRGQQPWNQVAFRMLNQLYQMTVTEVSKTPTPAITIAK